MGYLKPEYVIFETSQFEKKGIKEIDEFIERQEKEVKRYFKKFDKLTNSTIIYFMCWDGSKEGWDESNKGDEVREEFLNIIKDKFEYPTFIYLRLGGYEKGYSIYEIKA